MNQSPDLLRRLLRAKDRIDAAPHEPWTTQRLAQISAVSVAHFAREFKKAFGAPPHRYVLTRRMERAKSLLQNTDLPVTEVALQTGWSSIGTFGRVFQDVIGESPGGLRSRDGAVVRGMPECVARAVERPQLKSAVSEKRRQKSSGTLARESNRS